MSDNSSLEERVKSLEKQISEFGKPPRPVKEKKTREPSAYNEFMKKFIEKEKKADPTKSHKDLFSEGAKAWGLSKK
jgi:hypothetical protein